MTNHFGIDRRAVTPTVTHVLTITITSLLVIGLLATAGSFLNSEEQRNARDDLEMIGNRLADEVSRVDTLARNGGEAWIVTRHPPEVSGGRYTVEQLYGGDCPDSGSCLELRSHDTDVVARVPLANETDVSVETTGPGTYNVSGFDTDPSDDFENALSTGLSLRVGVAGDVTQDPLGTRLTERNDPPIPRFAVEPEPPTTGTWSFFNGSASQDPDGNVSEYKWDVGDDGLYTGRGEIASHWFDEPGRYEIKLRTADDADETAATSTTENVTVSGLEYQHDLSVGEQNQSIRYSYYNNWSEPIRLDSIFINDLDDGYNVLGDCDDEHLPDDEFNSEVNIDTDGDGDRNFYFEVDDGDYVSGGWDPDGTWVCDDELEIPSNGLIFDVDQQQNPAHDIDTNVDNEDVPTDVPIVPPGEEVTIELAVRDDASNVRSDLQDDLADSEWRLGVSYLRGQLGSETVFEDRVDAPQVTNFSVDADGDAVDVTIESADRLDNIFLDYGDNVSSSTYTGSFAETSTSDGWRYVAEDVVTGVSGLQWAEIDSVEHYDTGVEAYQLPDRESTITVDDANDATWHTVDDWDENFVDANVAHENIGDRTDDSVWLGYTGDDVDADNLTAYWPMDEGDGTMTDHRNASIGHDGTTTDIFDETVGLFGTTSYAFHQGTSRVDVPSNPQFSGGDDSTLTVSTWIHPRQNYANSNGSAVIGKLNSTTGGDWSLVIRDDCPGYASGGCDGTPAIGYYAGNETEEFALMHGPVTQEDTWHHVAFVLDEESGELSLYYDGRLEERVTDTPEFVTANTSRDVVFGHHPSTGKDFDGYIDETRIYNRSLSGPQILDLYRTTRSGAFTTDWENGTDTFASDEVNLSAAVDLNGADVTVTVVSNQSERSDPIELRDGNHDYDVTGLSTDANGWHLEVDVESTSPIMTPEIDKLVVHDDP